MIARSDVRGVDPTVRDGMLVPTWDKAPSEPGLLTVIIPVYNEEHNVANVLRRVREVPIRKEIIVVDDGSTDRTAGVLRDVLNEEGDLLVVHQAMINMGKGTAIRIGLKYARGDVVLIQDADLEYEPEDYAALIEPIRGGEAEVVYGNRFHRPIPGMAFKFRLANIILATMATILFGQRIPDEATAYKVFRRDLLLSLDLHASRFEFCPEVTAKVCRRGIRIRHVPIGYAPRTVAEGKKIRLRDAFHAAWTLFWFRFVD